MHPVFHRMIWIVPLLQLIQSQLMQLLQLIQLQLILHLWLLKQSLLVQLLMNLQILKLRIRYLKYKYGRLIKT